MTRYERAARILDLLREGPKTIAELRDASGFTTPQVRSAVRAWRMREQVHGRRVGGALVFSTMAPRAIGAPVDPPPAPAPPADALGAFRALRVAVLGHVALGTCEADDDDHDAATCGACQAESRLCDALDASVPWLGPMAEEVVALDPSPSAQEPA